MVSDPECVQVWCYVGRFPLIEHFFLTSDFDHFLRAKPLFSKRSNMGKFVYFDERWSCAKCCVVVFAERSECPIVHMGSVQDFRTCDGFSKKSASRWRFSASNRRRYGGVSTLKFLNITALSWNLVTLLSKTVKIMRLWFLNSFKKTRKNCHFCPFLAENRPFLGCFFGFSKVWTIRTFQYCVSLINNTFVVGKKHFWENSSIWLGGGGGG